MMNREGGVTCTRANSIPVNRLGMDMPKQWVVIRATRVQEYPPEFIGSSLGRHGAGTGVLSLHSHNFIIALFVPEL